MSGLLLAGDIGGTSTRIGLFDVVERRIAPVTVEKYVSHEHTGLDAIVQMFRRQHGQAIQGACFGVAGPVIGHHVETPNLAWDVDGATLARTLSLPKVGLINDLEANAHGVFTLTPADFVELNAGAPKATGNMAVISAGTGLGEAGMYWDGGRHHPFATEGGHADCAPRTELEIELARYLHRTLGPHVSWERVVSGPGLARVYEFLRDTGRGTEPSWLTEALKVGDPPAIVSTAALDGKSDLCVQALDLFIDVYGGEAGNLALNLMATGGVYVGGGIAPRIIRKLREPRFMKAFADKGRLTPLLETIPVRVITNDETALFGAARCAALRASLL